MVTVQQIETNVTSTPMAGIVSKEMQGEKWWPNVHRLKNAVQATLPGWMVIILQWLKVVLKRKSVSVESLQTMAEIVATIM